MNHESWEQSDKVWPYIITAPIGVLVAAWVKLRGEWRVVTGKLTDVIPYNPEHTEGYLCIETIKGSQFEIPFDEVIWIKTGSYWPRYLMDHFRLVKAERRQRKEK